MIPKKPAPDLIISAFTRVFRRAMGGYRFSEKIMLHKKLERDDDSKKSQPGLAHI